MPSRIGFFIYLAPPNVGLGGSFSDSTLSYTCILSPKFEFIYFILNFK